MFYVLECVLRSIAKIKGDYSWNISKYNVVGLPVMSWMVIDHEQAISVEYWHIIPILFHILCLDVL